MESSTRRKPGPKPGSRHPGMFRKGDPRINYGGRPRKAPEVRQLEELCRESAEDALNLLLDVISDRNAATRDRLTAARELLDRGFGKPIDRQAVLNLNSGSGVDGEDLSTDQLLRIAAGALGEQARDPAQVLEFRGKTIDGETE